METILEILPWNSLLKFRNTSFSSDAFNAEIDAFSICAQLLEAFEK